MIICPNCQSQNPPGSIFCDSCGGSLQNAAPPMGPYGAPPNSLSEQATLLQPPPPPPAPMIIPGGDVICPQCNKQNPPTEQFCGNCGYELRSTSANASAPTVVAPDPSAYGAPPPPPMSSAYGAPPPPPMSSAYGAPPPVPAYGAPPPPPAVGAPPIFNMPPTPFSGMMAPPAGATITGRLVIQEGNVTIPIPAGKTVITLGREDAASGVFPDIDFDPYNGWNSGVGRHHAQLILQGGQLFIEDLGSVNFTFLNRQKLTPNHKYPLNHGNDIRLGKMALIYYSQ